jgi:MFS family permease
MESSAELESRSISMVAYGRLLRRNANFRRLWMAQIVSEIGDWFYTLAIYNLLLTLTGRASSVGLALLLQVLPQTFIGPIAGVVNDRISRKRVMIAADLVRAAIVLSMLLVRSRSTVWLVYPLLLAETLMAAFFEPARSSVIPNITPRNDLVVANTLSSMTWSMNLVLGATIGGIVAAFLGRDAVFLLNALSFLASAVLIRRMRFVEPHAEGAPPLRAKDLVDVSPFMEGVRYVRRNRRLFATVLVKAGNVVIGPSWVLFTVMGQRTFPVHWQGIDPQRGAMLGMSLLLGARGLGALTGPLFTAPWAGHSQKKLQLGILIGFMVSGMGYVIMAQAKFVWIACLFVALAHCGGSTVWVFSTTLLQMHTDDRFRGRVFAADLGFCMLTIAVGAFLCGAFLDAGASPRMVGTVAGLLMFVPAALWALALRSFKRESRDDCTEQVSC